MNFLYWAFAWKFLGRLDRDETHRSVIRPRVVDEDKGRKSSREYDILEQQNVRLGRVNLVVLPPQTLRDPQASPLFLVEDLECSRLDVKVILGDGLQHLLWEHNMPGFLVSLGLLQSRRQPGARKGAGN